MDEKSTFVDMIQEATRQRYRRTRTRETKPLIEEDKPRVGRWPPPRQRQWRLSLLKSWKSDEEV